MYYYIIKTNLLKATSFFVRFMYSCMKFELQDFAKKSHILAYCTCNLQISSNKLKYVLTHFILNQLIN